VNTEELTGVSMQQMNHSAVMYGGLDLRGQRLQHVLSGSQNQTQAIERVFRCAKLLAQRYSVYQSPRRSTALRSQQHARLQLVG
jgi:hypothetical protein